MGVARTRGPRAAGTHRALVLGTASAVAVLVSAATLAEDVRTVRLAAPGSHLRADVAPEHGADLAGLEVKVGERWVQLLYRGNDYSPTKDFRGKAPILWPATGRNLLETADPKATGDNLGWMVDGVRYPMPIHGFARDLAWTVTQSERGHDQARIRLILRDSPASRRYYPFGFTLTTEYGLRGDVLTIRQTVQAAAGNTRPMPFSIGNHVTFTLPLLPAGRADAVQFETPARKQILMDAAGRPTGETRPVDFGAPRPLSVLQRRVSVLLGDYPSSTPWVRLIDPAGLSVTVSHTESRRPAGEPVLFTLWGDVDAGFFSPEPWVGKPNSLVTGDGVITLSPGEELEWVISVAVALHR